MELSKEELGFVEWLTEREYMSPLSSISVPMDIPKMSDVRLPFETYAKIKNDLNMLFGFAAVVLRCKRSDITADKLRNFMGFVYTLRSRSADEIAKERDEFHKKYIEVSEAFDKCTCDARKKWLHDIEIIDRGSWDYITYGPYPEDREVLPKRRKRKKADK